ncbi:MAG: PEP-CTERM sorting domain-containing protein [Candidatus Nealsonbacteria bacterium]|nr:PEP-CTERM sorting domain-containing protein [Candidatus Nealsonbacteria bacterium]
MLKKCTWISMLLAVALVTVAAQAETIYENGDFEDDAALVPNPGDTAAVIPTGWQYSDYYGYGVEPVLMNVSAIGDGSGGIVGVKFPSWNGEAGWDSCITRFEQPVEPGQYTYTVTLTGVDLIGGDNWISLDLYWADNPADPWADDHYDFLTGTDWVELTAADDGVWQTRAMDFEILPGDPAVGTYFAPWVHGQNYDGNMIVGEASLTRVPEPATIWLLVASVLALCLYRRK